MQKFDAASSAVLRMLIAIWSHELILCAFEHPPRYMVPRSPVVFHLSLKYMVEARLATRTRAAMIEHPRKTISLFDRQIRQV